MKTQNQAFYRWMIKADLEEVLEIESFIFGDNSWKASDFNDILSNRDIVGMVIECNGKVVGYMVYGFNNNKIDLLNIAVSPWYQRGGFGSILISKLLDRLYIFQKRNKIRVIVRESNIQALNFFKKHNFKAVKVKRNFYENCEDDAICMIFKKTA